MRVLAGAFAALLFALGYMLIGALVVIFGVIVPLCRLLWPVAVVWACVWVVWRGM